MGTCPIILNTGSYTLPGEGLITPLKLPKTQGRLSHNLIIAARSPGTPSEPTLRLMLCPEP